MFTAKRTENNGEIKVTIPPIVGYGTVNYFCMCTEDKPLANPVMTNGQLLLDTVSTKFIQDTTKSRTKLFKGLTPGVTYYFYIYASNTVSVAPLSDVISVMAAG